MPIGALISGGLNVAGGILSGNAAADAARTSARAQKEAARIAAEESRFRPVGVTTRFGSSNFTFGPEGRLSGAGYELTPEMKAYQDRLMMLSGGALTDAEAAREQYQPLTGAATSLFDLGTQYLAESPEEVAAKYMASQQDLLAPSRERQYAQLQNQLFQTGRGGLAVGATGARPSGAAGLGATTPETEAYYNALAQQDAQLAAQAQQAGQQQLAFGTGLFNQGAGMLGNFQAGQIGALSPFTTYLGGVGTIESMGQSPLDIGAQLGGRAAQAGANAGQSLLQGGLKSAQTMQQANAYSPWGTALQGIGSSPNIGNIFSGGSGSSGGSSSGGGGGTWGGGGGYGSVYY
jgi:hypothetical protein